jgi:hypothetical protein
MKDEKSTNINPLRNSDTDERQSMNGGLFANEEEAAKQDRDKVQNTRGGHGQKMDSKAPDEQDEERLDPDVEMEQKG